MPSSVLDVNRLVTAVLPGEIMTDLRALARTDRVQYRSRYVFGSHRADTSAVAARRSTLAAMIRLRPASFAA
jgi:hypothetical protein